MMKIFSTAQIRAWDAYTIEHEPVASIELMNRAARAFCDWFIRKYTDTDRPIVVVAGTGNNGGDGLAIARYLHQHFYEAKVFVYNFGEKRSTDFESQLLLMPPHDAVELTWNDQIDQFPAFPINAIVIDALFGSGLNRPLTGHWAQVVHWINQLYNERVSVDIPSGLFADQASNGNAMVLADQTFSFEIPKRAFLFPENADRVGEWHIGSIGLHAAYEQKETTPFRYATHADMAALHRSRKTYAHKGTYGHALLVTGSYGKMGAAVLSAKACLRAGVGLLTVHAPRCGFLVLQTAVPEAMFSADARAKFCTQVHDIDKYTAIGVGPGLGMAPRTAAGLEQLFRDAKSPMVIDADALNLLAVHPSWWDYVPENSILTPHPKEFERLFGPTSNDFERNDLQRAKAQEHRVIIVLKGAHTAVAAPDGSCSFNSTGNPGMATGGSGDALTGILTGLLAQGYAPHTAALLGVYIHGMAGDLAANTLGQEALVAGDIAAFLGQAWNTLSTP